jgi:hypothetical protein
MRGISLDYSVLLRTNGLSAMPGKPDRLDMTRLLSTHGLAAMPGKPGDQIA